MKYEVLIIIAICVLHCSCEKMDEESPNYLSESINLYITENSPSGNTSLYEPFLIDDSVIHIKVPHTSSLDNVTLHFTLDYPSGEKLFHDTEELVSGVTTANLSDFTDSFKLKQQSGEVKKNWTIQLYDLPVLLVDTPNKTDITSTKIRTEGCFVKLVDEKGNLIDLGTGGIKGRGNSSWQQPKKPYNIKLDKKHSILGMKKSKHWILLANAYYDRTQLHNATAFEMARLTDFPWVQSGTFVELIFNGKHKGLYYLCEKIRIEDGRIDIDEINPTDLAGEALTGGYLLESEVGTENVDTTLFVYTDYYNKTGRGFKWNLAWRPKHPEKGEVPPEQMRYLQQSLNHLEMLIMNEDSLKVGNYRDYFDIETAINWWFVQEASLNEEATRTKNLYLYKDRGGKFKVGPPWDLDAWTFGLYGTSHYYCTKVAFYYEGLFKDPVFVKRLKEKWGGAKNNMA